MFYKKLVLIFVFFIIFKSYSAQYPQMFEGEFDQYKEIGLEENSGKYKNARLDLISKFLPDNPMIFEAGGHYGYDTINFAKKWPKGTVVSFEPNPNAFNKLIDRTKDIANIHCFNLAINDFNGFAILNVCYGTSGDNPIYEGASSLLEASSWMEIHYKGPKVKVPCVVLEDWCKDNNIDHFDFIWLDLEGLELHILKSSPEILKKISVIYTETNFLEFRKNMTQYKELKLFLEKNGFKLAAHWYRKGLQGNAIFVKKEIFFDILSKTKSNKRRKR